MIEDDNDRHYSQQVRPTDVTIDLNDCMKCYVRLTKYKVNFASVHNQDA